MAPDAPCLIYITVSSADEGAAIARALIDERLAACANLIGPVRSFYRWEGEVRDDPEYSLIAKTTGARVEALTARVRSLHGYSLPCVVALPIEGGNPPFLDWIREETASGGGGD